jgi:hypothetical protein
MQYYRNFLEGSKFLYENHDRHLYASCLLGSDLKAIGREVMEADRVYELGERDVSYNHNFAGENSGLRPENSYFWNLSI